MRSGSIPRELVALILRANLLERRGRTHEASRRLRRGRRPSLRRCRSCRPSCARPSPRRVAYVEKYNRDKGRFLDAYLDQHYQTFAGENLEPVPRRRSTSWSAARSATTRSRCSTTIRSSRRSSSSTAASFRGSESLEAATDDIRDEFLGVLRTEEGFTPYISYPAGRAAQPVRGAQQFAALERVPPVQDRGSASTQTRRGARRPWRCWRGAPSRTSRDARRRRCSRC